MLIRLVMVFRTKLLIVILCVSCTLMAQSRQPPVLPSQGSIRGSVLLPNGSFLNESVKITLQSFRGVKSSVYTDNHGQFQFNNLAGGNYQITVEADPKRFEVTTATVEVYPGGPAVLSITLREKNLTEESKPPGSTVSAIELDANVPAKARKEFERGNDASKNGKPEEAITHLRKAIEIYPKYLMARNDLGVILLSQGKLEDAERELIEAVALDAKAFNPHLNLGIVLVHRQKFQPAVDNLKIAVDLEGKSPAAQLYYGIALEGLKEFDAAQRALVTAHDIGGVRFALALFHLGQIHLSKNEPELARRMFEAYLREDPQAANAAQVRKLIALLP